MKTVSYWNGRVVGDDDVSGYVVNDEIDEVEWVPLRRGAATRLTYPHDRDTLREALAPCAARPRRWSCCATAQARSRKAWRSDDRLRPLLAAGHAAGPAAGAGARGVRRDPGGHLQQHPLRRRRVAPYAEATGWQLELEDGLSEEDATAGVGASGSSTTCSTAARARCCAPTGRCCRRSSTRSASTTAARARAACSWSHHRQGKVVGHRAPSADAEVKAPGPVHVMAVSPARRPSTNGRSEFTPRSPSPPEPDTCAP